MLEGKLPHPSEKNYGSCASCNTCVLHRSYKLRVHIPNFPQLLFLVNSWTCAGPPSVFALSQASTGPEWRTMSSRKAFALGKVYLSRVLCDLTGCCSIATYSPRLKMWSDAKILRKMVRWGWKRFFFDLIP